MRFALLPSALASQSSLSLPKTMCFPSGDHFALTPPVRRSPIRRGEPEGKGKAHNDSLLPAAPFAATNNSDLSGERSNGKTFLNEVGIVVASPPLIETCLRRFSPLFGSDSMRYTRAPSVTM